MKVVINRCFGVFGVSDKGFERLIELGMTVTEYADVGHKNPEADIVKSNSTGAIFGGPYHFLKCLVDLRTDLRLVQMVEELGGEASGDFAELAVVEVPDGAEHIAEKHRTWS